MAENNDSPQAPTTRSQQPHPLLCETCKNKKCPEYQQRGVSHLQYIDNNCIDSKNGSPKEYRVYSPKYFTELYGCASHTSAPAREQPQPVLAWAIKAPDGSFVPDTVASDRWKSVMNMISGSIIHARHREYWTEVLYKEGYRCVRVRVEEIVE